MCYKVQMLVYGTYDFLVIDRFNISLERDLAWMRKKGPWVNLTNILCTAFVPVDLRCFLAINKKFIIA